MNLVTRFVCFWGVLIIFIGVVALSFMPYNPIRLSTNTKFAMLNIAPQGWGFFTRNPREERFMVFDENKNEIDFRITSASNLFGLKRRNRAMTSEVANILNKVNANNVISCDGSIFDCISNLEINQLDTVDNIVSSPVLCGKYFIKIQKPIPWAWSKSWKEIIIPYKMASVMITCNQ